MAWTTPRTWVTAEMVTAAMLNEQVRDNENYLYSQFNTTTGHDHDGTDSKRIAWTNMPAATFTTWISGALAVQTSYEGGAARGHPNGYAEGPYGDTVEMLFAVPIPATWCGQAVHITQIDFYGYTASNTPYFDTIYLRRSDLDGTVTDDVTYTTDLGNGSSGNVNATIYAGDLALSDYPYMLVVKCAGSGQYGDYRVYGFKVSWTA